jgi:hypothetical protein
VIQTNEHAVWRRFLCYKFKIRFVEQIDPNEKYDRLKDPELIKNATTDKRYQEALLAILMHYRRELYANYGGRILQVPKPTIDKETEEYRMKEDIFERFIVKRIICENGTRQEMDVLIDNFKNWHRGETNENFSMMNDDIIHVFRNSSIEKYIREGSSGYYIENISSMEMGRFATDDDTLLSTWRKDNK